MRHKNELLKERRLARALKQESDERLLYVHRGLVQRLEQSSEEERVALFAQAHARIALWERDRLCHASYCQAWRTLLDQPLCLVGEKMLQDTPEGVALRQNSPFGFLIGKDGEGVDDEERA